MSQISGVPQADQPLKQAGVTAPYLMKGQSLGVDLQSFLALAKGLPFDVGEAQRKFGLEIFDKMLRDGAVASGVRKWKQEILSAEFRIVPPKGFEEDEAVLKDCAFLARCIDRLDTRIEDLAWRMLDAGVYGHSLLEVTWADGRGEDAGSQVLGSLRVIPSEVYNIVQDPYGRFLGVIGAIPGRVPFQWVGPIMANLSQIPGFVPWWKFALLVHDGKAGNLNGRSRLEAAYNAYWIKYRNWVLYLRHLVRYAGVKPIGIVGENAASEDPAKTPAQELSEMLSAFDGSVDALALPQGCDVRWDQLPGGESPYIKTIETCNREIATCILGNARTQVEAQHGSKADVSGAQDSVDEDTDFTADQLCDVITRQVFRPLMRHNRGADAPCPVLTLAIDSDDFADVAPAVAALYTAGAVADNQDAFYAKKLGAPAPDKSLSERKAEAAPKPTENPAKPLPPK